MVTQGPSFPMADNRRPRELFVSLLFQAQNSPFNSGSTLAMEKSVKTDAAEALELSEKLVCGRGVPSPSPPFCPALTANHRIGYCQPLSHIDLF